MAPGVKSESIRMAIQAQFEIPRQRRVQEDLSQLIQKSSRRKYDKPREASQEDQEECMPEKQDEELHLDPGTEREFTLLDDAIEFKMTGHYPDGLN